MLRALHLVDTGPAPRLDLELAERLNVLTGDNGLGKSFVLEVIWWALTEVWTGHPAGPHRAPGQRYAPERSSPTIAWQDVAGAVRRESTYNHRRQSWSRTVEWPPPSGPVLYARADGSFHVADPLRPQVGEDSSRRGDFAVLQLDEASIWGGLKIGNEAVCKGLLDDWVNWQLMHAAGQASPFPHLTRVLELLSPHPDEQLRLGQPARVSVTQAQDVPVLDFPHAAVPMIHASTGMRRILGLAYMLVWTWHEHTRTAALVGARPADRLVFLMDEVEAHLHPQWQRRIVPALLGVLGSLWGDVKIQVVVTTHAPLVLASLEPSFDPDRDALFRFQVEAGRAAIERQVWAKQGDASNWLVSANFGLEQARSLEAEHAIAAAQAYMRGDLAGLPEDLRTVEAIEAALVRTLPDLDHFWPRWIVARHRTGAA